MTPTHISIEPLNSENYDMRCVQVETYLFKTGHWDYVNGTCEEPMPTGANQSAITEWHKKDKMARSELILTLSKSELKSVKGTNTSHELWQKLKNEHQSRGPARKATLLRKITLMKMNYGGNIRDHITEFFELVDKIEEVGLNINEDLLAIFLLNNLPDLYESFRIAMVTRDELPKPDVLKIKIIEESEARNAKNDNEQNALFVKQLGGNRRGGFKGRGGRKIHNSRDIQASERNGPGGRPLHGGDSNNKKHNEEDFKCHKCMWRTKSLRKTLPSALYWWTCKSGQGGRL
ncbi:uncharacterized protein LOC112464105 [Temnothorax curvispinosus]|uniref:Uncharacterized protein LOC112464105 n=1 Tax=Temnothorax curvispinosus TaxID=300111 RepID=A0A6J1R0P3_9HYME|nr:uncharacterized protein LOC112464105 [Temnothorax curvispinosus]